MSNHFVLNFNRRVLGPASAEKLAQQQVHQTIREPSSDIIQAIKNRDLNAKDVIEIRLDGERLGTAYLAACERIAAVGLTLADARDGGFDSLEELQAALKRARYRFKPLIDYLFYRVRFVFCNYRIKSEHTAGIRENY